MFDTKFVCTLIGLVVAAFAICTFENKSEIKETFLLGSGYMTSTSITEQTPDGHVNSAPGQNIYSAITAPTQGAKTGLQVANSDAAMMRGAAPVAAMMGGKENFNVAGRPVTNPGRKEPFGFQVPPNYQKMLAPRGAGNAEGWQNPNVQYNPPAHGKTGYAPTGQMQQYANMVQEGYSSCHSTTPENAFNAPPFGVPQPGYNQLGDQAAVIAGAPGATAQVVAEGLPITTMNQMGSAKDETVTLGVRPIASLNGRNRSAGDPIRGDLPIPACAGGMWKTSQQRAPQTVLRQGAMMAMFGGLDSTSTPSAFSGAGNNQTYGRMNSAAGLTAVAGAPIPNQQITQLGGVSGANLMVSNA